MLANLSAAETDEDLLYRLIRPEEELRQHPGGYRWFRSTNIIDLQHYRSPAEKERIRKVLLHGYRPGR
jgi:hypothetical protein